MQNDIGIYKITCRPNGKIYIGSSINLAKRIRGHKSDLRQNKHPNARLQNAYNKYGLANFTFEVIVNCEKTEVFALEQRHIDELPPGRLGFNIATCAENPRRGAKYTEAERANMSRALTGRQLSAQHRANISHGGLGVKKSEETRQRMRDSAAERSPSRHAKISAALLGRQKSEDHKKKIGEATRLRCLDPDYLAKLSQAHKDGHTPERSAAKTAQNIERMKDPAARAKISLALTGRKASPETKAKQSAALKGRKLSAEQKTLLSQLATARWAAKKAAHKNI